jgi:putative membrane protein
LAALVWVTAGTPALAHDVEALTDATAWSTWTLTADIVIPTALVALIYTAGMLRRAAATEGPRWPRHLLFFGGLAAVFLALQSPIDPIAERLFFIHQTQHLLLRMVGPLLLALAWPQGILIAGTPAAVRRTLLTPVVGNGAVRQVFRFATQPIVVTAIFIASLYVWQIPRLHNVALLNETIHYLMHATMLLAGLIFWWRIFDMRPAPQGLHYGARLMILWIVILSNIILGAYTTLKSTVLYGAYDVTGRLFDVRPLTDEQLGGVIIWIPSSMMCLIAVLIVIHMWGRHETRLDERRTTWSPSNSAALLYPTSASGVIERARPKNRLLALGITAFVVAVFATAIIAGVLNNRSGAARLAAKAKHHRLVQHAVHSAVPATTLR